MRVYRKHSVPENVHPLVRKLFEEMNREQIGVVDMAERSGVNKNTINDWKKRSVPNIVNLDACFSVLGKKISVYNSD